MRKLIGRLSPILFGLALIGASAAPAEATGLRFTQISTGEEYVCGVTQRGDVYCTGDNSYGKLGDGTDDDRDTWVKVSTTQRFAKVFAGYEHTCGITVRGTAYCWGENGDGNLGDGTNDDRFTPVQVLGLRGVLDLALTTENSTCAVTTRGTYCWGDNGDGNLGDGSEDDSAYPVKVAGTARFTNIAAQEDFTCALTTRGNAQCWGDNDYSDSSQLGIGSLTPAESSVPLNVLGGLRFKDLVVGSDAACGLTARGEVYCWGEDDGGSIGGASVDDGNLAAPQKVLGGIRFASLTQAGGEDHFCALSTRGTAYCWGENYDGQLGTGNDVDSESQGALKVEGGLRFSMISVNEYLSCGLTARGQVWCWGDYAGGTLHDGEDSYVPALVE